MCSCELHPGDVVWFFGFIFIYTFFFARLQIGFLLDYTYTCYRIRVVLVALLIPTFLSAFDNQIQLIPFTS